VFKLGNAETESVGKRILRRIIGPKKDEILIA
jgi:hypothetical protein